MEETTKAKEAIDVIDLPNAELFTANWRALAKEELLPNDNYVTAFHIPMVDFGQILAEGAVGIRAYLANTNNNEKKLLLVGVDAEGKDMIDYNEGKFVYDFTTPCPAMCDQGSPLNGIQ